MARRTNRPHPGRLVIPIFFKISEFFFFAAVAGLDFEEALIGVTPEPATLYYLDYLERRDEKNALFCNIKKATDCFIGM